MLSLMPHLITAVRGVWRAVPEGIQEVLDESGGLGPRHARVLAQLVLFGPQSVSELSKRLGLTLATTSLMTGELSQAGLVERREDPADRRRTIVSVSDDFGDELAPFFESRVNLVSNVIAGLEPTERDAFLKGLRLLIAEIDAL